MYSTRDRCIISILVMVFIVSMFPFGNMQVWDIDLLRSINNGRNVAMDGFFGVITDSATPVAIFIPVALFVYAFLFKNKLTGQIAVYSALTFLVTSITDTGIKHMVNKPRPFATYDFIQKITSGGSPSFPSGHTTDAFVTAAVLSLAFRKWYVIVPVYLWALLIAYSRMDLGVHYPSDVLAGMCLGTMMAFIGYRIWHSRIVIIKEL